MHDSAHRQNTKTITNIFTKMKLSVLPWPGNSQHLNMIKNVWELLKRKVAKENTKSRRNFTELLKKAWHHDETENFLIKFIQSMPTRAYAVIDSKEVSTKY